MPEIKYIQIFGLQCSGTNILKRLCELNFDIPTGERFGSKHGVNLNVIRDKRFEDVLFLYIHKNIHAWVCSMRDQTHGAMPRGLSVSAALRRGWAIRKFQFPNILKMREHVLTRFGNIEKNVANWINIRHIDLVVSPAAIIMALHKMFSIPFKCGKVPDVTIASHYKGELQNGKFPKKKYYLNKEYMQRLNDADIKFIEDNYDMSFESRSWLCVAE